MPDKRVTEWIKSKCHFPKLSRVNTAWGNISCRLSYSVGVRQHGTFRPGSQLENLTAALPQMVRITGWSFLAEKWKWSRIRHLVTSDYSLPGSSIHRIFQARLLEQAAISLSRGSSQPRDQTQVSCIADTHFIIWATREAHFSLPVHRAYKGKPRWDPQTARHSPTQSIRQPHNGPMQFPSFTFGSQSHLLLMDMNLGWQLLNVSQM